MTDPRRNAPSPSRFETPAARDGAAREAFGTLGATLALILAMVGGADAADEPRQVAVTVTAEACEPMEITVPAGPVAFTITNKSRRALEWEILDGVVVVDERENIAPGFKSKLTTRLKPGTYAITCGLLDNPRGRLIVTGAATKPSAADLVGLVAEYRVGNVASLRTLGDALAKARAADAAGDRAAARAAFEEARAAYLATSPIHDLAGAPAEVLAADFAAVDARLAADPAAPLGPLLDRLQADGPAFTAAVKPIVAPADRLLAGTTAIAVTMAGRIASTDAPPTAVARLAAERAAIERVVHLFAAATRSLDPAKAAAIDGALADLAAELARAPGPIGGFADARSLPDDRRAALVWAGRALADSLTPLPGLVF